MACSSACSSTGTSSETWTQSASRSSRLKTSWSIECGVVDDHDDLGVRVEVGARADHQLVQIEVLASHSGAHRTCAGRLLRRATPARSAGASPRPRRRAARGPCGYAWRSTPRPAGAPRRRAARRASSEPVPRSSARMRSSSASMSSGFSPLEARRYDFASRNCRISASRTSAEIGAEGPPVEPCGKSCSIESGPLPICLKASPETAKERAASGIATRTMMRITSPFETASWSTIGRGYGALSLPGLSY